MNFCLALVPLTDVANPVVSGSFQSWGGWLWWEWKFLNGWSEWIPAYPFIQSMVSYSYASHFVNAMTPAGMLNQKVHALATFRCLHEAIVLNGDRGPEDMCIMADEQIDYYDTTLTKSNWYYGSIPHFGSSLATCRVSQVALLLLSKCHG